GKNTLYMPSNEAIKQEAKNNKYAIGYIGMGYMDKSVKSLKVDSIEPSVQNVADKKYPIAREIYWYVIDTDNKDVNGLVDFALSADGQRVVADEGFVPAK
ncbi:MAG: substrate-binding domain-containing protein, partial [Cetobacterium sp.]